MRGTASDAATLRIGTRGSRLARWQADRVAEDLAAIAGSPPVEIVEIRTEGDRITDVPLSRVAGKAFFTKEIEAALADRRVDLAVHSLKDLATVHPPGLVIGAVLEREDPRDALLTRSGGGLAELAAGAVVGTSSLRRQAMLRRWRPDLEIAELRGNVPTRVERLEEGDYDAIVLAAAGLNRLGLADRISEHLDPDRFPPAVSQGAMAVQVRADDRATAAWVAGLDHPPTARATRAERALLRRLEGGCQIPVGALCVEEDGELRLSAAVSSLDGTEVVSGQRRGPADRPREVGLELAEELLASGADEILAAIRARFGTSGEVRG